MPNQLDRPAARALVDQITVGLDQLRDAVIQLWEGRGWLALGYSSWDDLCSAEFRMRLQLPRTERVEVVSQLTERGLSARAIAPALGVGVATVHRDRAGVPNGTPATGLDGKRYPTRRPTVVPLRPAPAQGQPDTRPRPQPVVTIAVRLGEAFRTVQPIEQELASLPTEMAGRDLEELQRRIICIRRVLDRLATRLEET
jgi:hypothetical protein